MAEPRMTSAGVHGRIDWWIDRQINRRVQRRSRGRAAVVVLGLVAALLLVAGCGGEQDTDEDAGSAAGAWGGSAARDVAQDVAQGPPVAAPISGRAAPVGGLEGVKGPVDFHSPAGRFRATWPAGCAQMVTRTPRDAPALRDYPGDEPTTLTVYCDRAGRTGEGAVVVVYFNEKNDDGGPPTPAMVATRIQRTLGSYNAQVVVQRTVSLSNPYGRDSQGGDSQGGDSQDGELQDGKLQEGKLMGIEVLAREDQGVGEVWLRGFIVGSRYYMISAWKMDGMLFDNPEFVDFFDSFEFMED